MSDNLASIDFLVEAVDQVDAFRPSIISFHDVGCVTLVNKDL